LDHRPKKIATHVIVPAKISSEGGIHKKAVVYIADTLGETYLKGNGPVSEIKKSCYCARETAVLGARKEFTLPIERNPKQ
jgi:hypothetical protein